MRSLFTTDSPFFQKLSTVSELVILNLLTILCSLPITTIGASATALFYTTEKMRKAEKSSPKTFFYAFKENFKQATLIWGILLAIGILICFAILLYLQMNMPVLIGCSVLALILWGAVTSWVFPMLSHFYSTTWAAFKNAILCGTNFLPLSLAMSIVNLVPLALFLFVPGIFIRLIPLWLFIWFALAAYCNAGLLKGPFSTIIPTDPS